jgi:Protein of unknown function (DUF2975)
MAGDAEFAKAQKAQRKLTQPLENTVFMILTGLLVVLAVGLASTALDSHASTFGLGSSPVCTDAPLNGITLGGTAFSALPHLRPGATSSPSVVGVCTNRPSAAQRALVTLADAPTPLLYLAILLLLWQLLRTVRRAGPFTSLIGRRVRFLGWFILGGWLAVTVGQSVAQSYFISTVVTDQIPVISNVVNAVLRGVFPPVLIACGLLTLARVMRVGTRMNDDLAGTV